MKRSLILLVSALALLFLVLILSRPAAPPEVAPTVQQEEEREEPNPALQGSLQDSRTSQFERRAAAEHLGGAAEQGRARIFGRFLLPDGAPAAAVRVELGTEGQNSGGGDPQPQGWQDLSTESGPDGAFELLFGVPPAQLRLTARRADYAEELWSWDELAPDAAVDLGDVTLRLLEVGRLSGHVRWSGGEPAADVEVLIVKAGRRIPSGEGTDHPVKTTRTDAEGRYAIEEIQPRSYDLHALGTSWLKDSAPGLVVSSGSDQVVDFEVSRGARFRLTIPDLAEVPEGFGATLVTQIWPARAAVIARHPRDRVIPLTKGEGATWSASHLPPGPAEVLLGNSAWTKEPRLGNVVAGVELLEDELTELVLPLGDQRPGTGIVEVFADGQPLVGVKVRFILPPVLSSRGTGTTDSEGRVVVAGLLPGEYAIGVDLDSHVLYRGFGPLDVFPGQTTSVQVDLSSIPGEILLLKPDGSPLRSTEVDLDQRTAAGTFWARLRTDSSGVLPVSLLPGEVKLSCRKPRARASIEWLGVTVSETVQVRLRGY